RVARVDGHRRLVLATPTLRTRRQERVGVRRPRDHRVIAHVTAVRPVVVRQAHIRRRRLRRRQRDNQSCERKQTNAQHSPSKHRTPLLPYSPPKRSSQWRTLRPPSTAGRTLVEGLKPAAPLRPSASSFAGNSLVELAGLEPATSWVR